MSTEVRGFSVSVGARGFKKVKLMVAKVEASRLGVRSEFSDSNLRVEFRDLNLRRHGV